MDHLYTPEKDLVSRILGEVGYEGRFVGYRVHKRFGPLEMAMYRFSEVVSFLRENDILLDLDDLVRWIQIVIRDNELSYMVSQVLREESDLPERIQKIEQMMSKRLRQCESYS